MKRSVVWLAVWLAVAIAAVSASARSMNPGGAMARAASEFLATLTADQRKMATFPFASEERVNWHFVPRARKGISFKELSAEQRQKAHVFLRAVLGQRGHEKSTAIMSLEEVLRVIEGGRGPARDPDLYFFSFFGEPSPRETWGWRVEGHHLSLNFTVVKGQMIASTPQFLGANPAEVKDGPRRGVRVLKAEEDLARELLHSLDAGQRAKAMIATDAPRDIITGAARRAEIGEAKGVLVGEMSNKQRDLLVRLLKVYTEAMPKPVAGARMARLRQAGAEKIRFAWAGGAERGQPHYYRIQGPTFLVEYDNTQNNANHIHSVWRDFRGDFGDDLLAAHYREHHLAHTHQNEARRPAPKAEAARGRVQHRQVGVAAQLRAHPSLRSRFRPGALLLAPDDRAVARSDEHRIDRDDDLGGRGRRHHPARRAGRGGDVEHLGDARAGEEDEVGSRALGEGAEVDAVGAQRRRLRANDADRQPEGRGAEPEVALGAGRMSGFDHPRHASAGKADRLTDRILHHPRQDGFSLRGEGRHQPRPNLSRLHARLRAPLNGEGGDPRGSTLQAPLENDGRDDDALAGPQTSRGGASRGIDIGGGRRRCAERENQREQIT